MPAVKTKIEDIYPLSHMQEALLLHHMMHQGEDQGVIYTRCRLEGPLDEELFQQAWALTVARHPALRTSIHWEKVEKPVQVVRPTATIKWEPSAPTGQLKLNKTGIGSWYLEKNESDVYTFHWYSHHILIDGWSSGIILRDVFCYYDMLHEGIETRLPTLPTYRTFLSWKKSKDFQQAEIYWRERLTAIKPTLFPEKHGKEWNKYEEQSFLFSEETTIAIEKYCKQERITLNSLLHGMWGLLLSKHFTTTNPFFGTTIAGRTPEVPQLDQIVGLFAQILPVRAQVNSDTEVSEYLRELQLKLHNDNNYSYADTDQILAWSDSQKGKTLFNSLIIVQNYPWKELSGGGVRVTEYQGDLTTTFPITAIFIPIGQLKFHLRYQVSSISTELVNWIIKSLRQLLEQLIQSPSMRVSTLLTQLSESPKLINEAPMQTMNSVQNFQIPKGKVELKITEIWEELLGRSPISAEDDFFAIGGTSMLAIQLFGRIKRQFNLNLPPISLLQNRTIRKLALLMADPKEVEWTTVVPLRASGTKAPIFCFHAGLGHVFFYNDFAQAIPPNRPVFAIQPEGLDGESEVHSSIEEMAAHYLAEIRQLQPSGPYIFLAYCYSTAICVELARQLIESKEAAPHLIIVDSGPSITELDVATNYKVGRKSLRWHLSSIRKGKLKRVYLELMTRYLPHNMLSEQLRTEKRRQQMRDKLLPAYNKYLWPKFQGDIGLFISEERTSNAAIMARLNNWEKLALGGVHKYITPGNHKRLFHPGSVDHLAEAIEKYLDKSIVQK